MRANDQDPHDPLAPPPPVEIPDPAAPPGPAVRPLPGRAPPLPLPDDETDALPVARAGAPRSRSSRRAAARPSSGRLLRAGSSARITAAAHRAQKNAALPVALAATLLATTVALVLVSSQQPPPASEEPPRAAPGPRVRPPPPLPAPQPPAPPPLASRRPAVPSPDPVDPPGPDTPPPRPELLPLPEEPPVPGEPALVDPRDPVPSRPEAPQPEAPRPGAPRPVAPSRDPAGLPVPPTPPRAALEEGALVRLLGPSARPEKRLEAARALAERGSQPVARRELQRLGDAAVKSLLDAWKRERGAIRAHVAALVLERRRAVLAVVFDKAKYPDADHGAVGQPEVDRVVGELRRAWDDPFHELVREKRVAATLEELARLEALSRELPGEAPLEAARAEQVAAREAARLLALHEGPLDSRERATFEASQETLAWNARARTSLSEEERACILATNEYRTMLGLPALRVSEPLVQAARKHSQEMVGRGYFAHESPVPENATPDKRCQREGARYSGENIAQGSTSGRATFEQWYRSSGHHRNVLAAGARSIGVGVHEATWTQDFGPDVPR